MLPSITSLFSTRALSVLPLVMCLLGITVIARPIDQVWSGSTVQKNYHPEIVLQQYLKKDTKVLTDSVSFRIGSEKNDRIYRKSSMTTRTDKREIEETKLGHLHFTNEMEFRQALVRARIHATEWQSPNGDRKANWKYLFDALMYLIAAYNNVIDDETFANWDRARRKFHPGPLLGDESMVIALIVYYHTLAGDTSPCPNGKVSLRIGDDWFISPERKEEERASFTDARFVHIGSIKKDTAIDFVALRKYAATHTRFLGDGSPWLQSFERDLIKFQTSVGTAWENYFGKWLYADGIMAYLLGTEATICSRSDWMKKRHDPLPIYLNALNRRLPYYLRQQQTVALRIDNGGQNSTNDH
ncbi:hypothetical protein C8R42DRAFT_721996 [Lentinula raphanica]|nr:hypothetical protein C8R42DRAFT_721996 [Lentinula raphanica]